MKPFIGGQRPEVRGAFDTSGTSTTAEKWGDEGKKTPTEALTRALKELRSLDNTGSRVPTFDTVESKVGVTAHAAVASVIAVGTTPVASQAKDKENVMSPNQAPMKTMNAPRPG